ncbi:protein fem-1 homolog CG6966-like [Macrobrachium nipponense]|uniref:protein fem-1 homolog CG6966-like n=1 Tax=Macrobrachium nipponense TaxID=159736 RepID=UPI0030C898FF
MARRSHRALSTALRESRRGGIRYCVRQLFLDTRTVSGSSLNTEAQTSKNLAQISLTLINKKFICSLRQTIELLFFAVSAGGPLLSGVSPLWCAAFEEHYWVVAYLLSKGANPNGDTSFYSTPLQAACELGYFHIVRLLVEHGAYIEAADNRAVTCLMLASFGGHLEIVNYLLEVGADVNSKNIEGESALHACAKAGHLDVMKLLLEHNARMGADYSGLTPLLVASSRGHRDMVEYLLSRNDLVSAKEKADALELLGASLFSSTEDIVATVNYWKSAINQR